MESIKGNVFFAEKRLEECLIMTDKIRNPIYAGAFYPSDKKELSKMIDSFLSTVNKNEPKKLDGKLAALIVPHAGFVYSGPTAAFGFKSLSKSSPKRIILLGPSHQKYLKGCFGFSGIWSTPLGKINVQNAGLNIIEDDEEHSLEVELPFLQKTLKNFEFVPIIYGEINYEELSKICKGAADIDSVIIASSDLSHYNSYDKAVAIDKNTISAILSLDLEEFSRAGDACGKIGIAALMLLAKENNWKPVLLDYRNSGDTAGDKDNVVGYCAIAFFKSTAEGSKKKVRKAFVCNKNQSEDFSLTPVEEKYCIDLAKKSIEFYLENNSILNLSGLELKKVPKKLLEKKACFVTLTINGDLRGCIGNLTAYQPLFTEILENAVNAAFRDPRFEPLSKSELAKIKIEVSILTKPKELIFSDAEDLLSKICAGVDGLILSKGPYSATFLPSVWEDISKKEDFLTHLCQKAGLPKDEWKKSRIKVKRYYTIKAEES
ncbi:MAG: AmmeMemoRadiSam system protein B [Candidatus Diapherotrites archaeon]|nr:AmmeMemoRadiSam system protein B [Candidatus Diapherotrites archaeon]